MFIGATDSKNSTLVSKTEPFTLYFQVVKAIFSMLMIRMVRNYGIKSLAGMGNPGFSLGLNSELYINGGSVVYVFDKNGNQ